MDLQFWIYVIVAVIVVFRSLMKKAENQPTQTPESPRPERRQVRYEPKQGQEKPKALTFEELLREITEAKQAPIPVFESRTSENEKVVDYDDEIETEERSLEEVDVSYKKKNPLYDVYEQGKKDAFMRKSLEETMNVRDTNVEFGKFKVFEQEKKRNLIEEYELNFQDTNDLKKAIVMSEILKRRF